MDHKPDQTGACRTLNPAALAFGSYPDDMKYVAEMFGREVEAMIATSRFIQDARETEKQEGNRLAYQLLQSLPP
jgi:hypothetical protein